MPPYSARAEPVPSAAGRTGGWSGRVLAMGVVGTAALLAIGSRGAPLSGFWRALPADSLLVLLDLTPVFVLGALGMIGAAMLSGRRSRGQSAARNGTRFRDRILRSLPPTAVVVTTVCLLLLVDGEVPAPVAGDAYRVVEVDAVRISPVRWGMSHWFELGLVAREGREKEEQEGVPGSLPGGGDLGALLRMVMLAAVLGVAGTWLGLRLLRRGSADEDVDPEAAMADRRAMRSALAAMIEAMLADPDPNTAIRGAYAGLLSTLDARGRGRWDHEGPTEHLQRILRTLQVHPVPLRELIELFEMARFSPLALTATHRDRALLALRAVASELEGSA